MLKPITFAGVLFASLPLLHGGAARAGDVEKGRSLSEDWCSRCHMVSAEQEPVTDVAKPFPTIANDPLRNEEGMAVWLADPHPVMPDLSLSRQEIDDILSYIESLKTD